MLDLMDWNYINQWMIKVILVDLVVAIALITGLRYLSGWVANVKTLSELAVKDNHAFGVALAGGILAMVVMLTGVVAGDEGQSLLDEFFLMSGYGILGIVLIKVGRTLQDKLVLSSLPVQSEILAGNMSAAIVDLANTVATAVIVRSAMVWSDGVGTQNIISVVLAFFGSQLLMAASIRAALATYKRRNLGASMEAALGKGSGSVAIAVRYMGHLMGVALAIAAASYFMGYDMGQPWVSFSYWIGFALIFALMVTLLSRFARRCILATVDVYDEVEKQDNVAVAAVEAVIYFSIGFYFVALLS